MTRFYIQVRDHLLLALGWILLILGLVITPLPIPVGLILALCGLAILTMKSHSLRAYLIRSRQRYKGVSDRLTRVTPRLPKFLRQAVELTDPNRKAQD